MRTRRNRNLQMFIQQRLRFTYIHSVILLRWRSASFFCRLTDSWHRLEFKRGKKRRYHQHQSDVKFNHHKKNKRVNLNSIFCGVYKRLCTQEMQWNYRVFFSPSNGDGCNIVFLDWKKKTIKKNLLKNPNEKLE